MAQKDKQRKDSFESLQSLENETLERQIAIKAKIEEAHSGRENILLRLAENDQSATADLKSLDENISKLYIELQSLDVLLKTLPARHDYVQGEEIETALPKMEQFANSLPVFVGEVKAKIKQLNAASKDFRNFMQKANEFKGFSNLALMSDVLATGSYVMESSAPRPGVASDAKPVPVELEIIAAFFDDEKCTALIERMKSTIVLRIERMRDHSQRLKGKDMPVLEWAYCPGCYENMNGGPDSQGRCHCSRCGKTFAAEKVPGMIIPQGS